MYFRPAMKRLSIFFYFFIHASAMQGAVQYFVSFPKPETHYIHVEIEIDNPGSSTHEFVMPVWTPGSYKVREFSRNVVEFGLMSGGQSFVKKNKNTWSVQAIKGSKKLRIFYEVYAFEYTVRTSYLDQFQAFIHGVSTFMYVEGMQKLPCKIAFDVPPAWIQITVALPKDGKSGFLAENYDLLADSPFALGNHAVIEFIAAGVQHRIAMLGEGNYDADKLKADFTKIIEKEFQMFKVHPSPEYVIFIQNVESGGGGLEHLNSQTSVIQRWAYTNETKYKSFLGLFAHEYFHLWNVKRIRPIELGPFDYTQETYTTMLWIAEGFTAYYDDLFLKRCAFYKDDEYLAIVASAISRIENLPGNKVQSLAMSSFDAWIKFYITDENSDNSSISYYQKGMLAAMLIDLEIINRTNGTKKLDDVMQYLYNEYYVKKKRGFTENEFAESLETVSGTSFKDMLDSVVYTTKPIDYEKYFHYVGLELKNPKSGKWSLGIQVKNENGKQIIKYVEIGGPASVAGLSVNDEIIGVGGYRFNGDMDELGLRLKDGVKVDLLISRMGHIVTIPVQAQKDLQVNYKLSKTSKPSEQQQKLLDFWLK